MKQDIINRAQEENLWKAYRDESKKSSPGPCLTDEDKGAFIENNMKEAERDRAYQHISLCDPCFVSIKDLREFLKDSLEEERANSAGKGNVVSMISFMGGASVSSVGRRVAAAVVLAATCYLGYAVGNSTSSDDNESRDFLRNKVTQEMYLEHDRFLIPAGASGY